MKNNSLNQQKEAIRYKFHWLANEKAVYDTPAFHRKCPKRETATAKSGGVSQTTNVRGIVGTKMSGNFETKSCPLIQLSSSILRANLSVRQYMPYKRTVEFMEDIFGISMSEGTVPNLLGQFERSAAGEYNRIRNQVLHSPVVGADETSAKVNGTKGWFHTYQTPEHTFIGYHPSRGTMAQKHFYPDGMPNSILVSDCLPMQLSTPAAAHQVCHVHILRELHAMEENHPKQSWPGKMKDVILEALKLREQPHCSKKVKAIEKKFEKLIKTNQSNAPGKIPAFWKRMNNIRIKF